MTRDCPNPNPSFGPAKSVPGIGARQFCSIWGGWSCAGPTFTIPPAEPDQRPERDYGSTTYLAAIVSADDFGPWLRNEALRRGMGSAQTVVFPGDGAVWVWKLARLNFPGAICILDYYHACEHLSRLSVALYGEGGGRAKRRYRLWKKWRLNDTVAEIISQAKADLPQEFAA